MSLLSKVKRRVFKTAAPVAKTEEPDEFLGWLHFANAGMLAPGNIAGIEYAISHLPDASPIVEIGSFCGLSANVISYLLTKYQAANELICSDAWIFEGARGDAQLGKHPHVTHAAYREYVRSSFMRNVQFFNPHRVPYAVELVSDQFIEAWTRADSVTDVFGRTRKLGGRISFAYIDGDHTYEQCKRDFQNIDRLLAPGGFILLDDSSCPQFGVGSVLKEALQSNTYRLILENPNALLQKLGAPADQPLMKKR